MSILLRWHYRWMLQLLSTPFSREPSFNCFTQPRASCFYFSSLFNPFMPNKFPFFQPPFHFGRIFSHPLFGKHALKQFACRTSLCASPFLFVAMFCASFFILYFPSLVDNIQIIGLTFFFFFDHFVFWFAFVGFMV